MPFCGVPMSGVHDCPLKGCALLVALKLASMKAPLCLTSSIINATDEKSGRGLWPVVGALSSKAGVKSRALLYTASPHDPICAFAV